MKLWGLRYWKGGPRRPASCPLSLEGTGHPGRSPGPNGVPCASAPRPREMWRPRKGERRFAASRRRVPPPPHAAGAGPGPGARPAQPMGATGGVRAPGDRERRESLKSPRRFPGSQILSAGANNARGASEPARSEPAPPPRPHPCALGRRPKR
ncbi:translation initiation factor IF-2-like [Myotis myotis]|uniref:translation initiation factor IF-2-like n=1 Tax=Myotis myotis TaxID=51298 RepID=UPI00174ABAF3|nr:translation initiation factor IF-2-like [Myotis myotis]